MSTRRSRDTAPLASRLRAQLLAGPQAASPEQVLERIAAVQGQDPRGARLAVRARSTIASAADIEDALTHRRSAVVSWLNRGTLHLVAARDYWWLHPLTTPQLRTGNERRLGQEGVDPGDAARGVDIVAEAVVRDGPLTRSELRERLDRAGIRTQGQALVHLLVAATLAGHVVRGPMRAGEQAYVDVRTWLGTPPAALAREEALARLARRYLAGHGPATAADLAKWAGIPLGAARTGIGLIADEVRTLPDDLVDLADRPPAGGMPPPRLLGAYDPVLHGWVDRSALVGRHTGVVTSNGLFRPTALVDGRVVGTWGLAAGRIELRLLEPVRAAARQALNRDAGAVLDFLGMSPTDPLII